MTITKPKTQLVTSDQSQQTQRLTNQNSKEKTCNWLKGRENAANFSFGYWLAETAAVFVMIGCSDWNDLFNQNRGCAHWNIWHVFKASNGNTYTTSPSSQCEGSIHAGIVDLYMFTCGGFRKGSRLWDLLSSTRNAYRIKIFPFHSNVVKEALR